MTAEAATAVLPLEDGSTVVGGKRGGGGFLARVNALGETLFAVLHKLLRQGMSAVAILPEREVAAGTLESFPMRRLDVPGLDLAPVLIWLEHAYLSRTARRVIQCLHKVNADPGEQPDFEI